MLAAMSRTRTEASPASREVTSASVGDDASVPGPQASAREKSGRSSVEPKRSFFEAGALKGMASSCPGRKAWTSNEPSEPPDKGPLGFDLCLEVQRPHSE